MNCAQVKERLIDFLYDELPPDARAAFAEHLSGCSACKAEVASYQQTLGSARVALAGPLNEEPPARVHLAVIEAAKAAGKQTAAAKAKPTAPRDELGFFARLWRTPWFLPAFGAASVATVVFLVRVLKNPEVLPGQHPHSIEERAAASPEPAAPPAAVLAPKPAAIPEAEAKAKADSDHGKAVRSVRGTGKRATSEVAAPTDTPTVHAKSKKSMSDDSLSGLNLGGGPSSSGGLGRFAEPPPPRQAGSKSNKSLDDLLGDVEKKESTQYRAQPAMAPAGGKADRTVSDDEEAFDGLSAAASAPAKKAPRPEPAAEMAKPTLHSVTRSAGASAAAAAPSYAPAPAAAPTARRERDYPAQPAASEAMPSAPPIVRHREEKQAEQAPEGSAQADSKFLAKDKVAKGESKAGSPTLDESVRKADRLYASQDWSAAAAAYRELINRFPNHRDAPKWRDRMNESNAAYVRALEAKRKKTTSDDPLSGSK
jgi:anti-sigma factor RsiW